MPIREKPANAMNRDERNRSRGDILEHQLKAHAGFRKWMKNNGIVPRKQEFSIPLVERIGISSFSRFPRSIDVQR